MFMAQNIKVLLYFAAHFHIDTAHLLIAKLKKLPLQMQTL